jgi:hypothetical protein
VSIGQLHIRIANVTLFLQNPNVSSIKLTKIIALRANLHPQGVRAIRVRALRPHKASAVVCKSPRLLSPLTFYFLLFKCYQSVVDEVAEGVAHVADERGYAVA